MPEDKLVTVKAFHEDREWLKDEQAKIRKSGLPEPTHGEIIHALIQRAKGGTPLKTGRSSRHKNLVSLFHEALDAEDAEALESVERTLLIYRRLRGGDPKATAPGGAKP